jgi:serine/threonine protein phosphatase PrpC
VEVTEIERILAEWAGDDGKAVKALWTSALNAGGHDNISIVLVRAHRVSAPAMPSHL